MSCSVVSPERARRSARCRFAVLGRTPTRAAASATEPPAATKAARTSTWRAVGVRESAPRRYPSLTGSGSRRVRPAGDYLDGSTRRRRPCRASCRAHVHADRRQAAGARLSRTCRPGRSRTRGRPPRRRRRRRWTQAQGDALEPAGQERHRPAPAPLHSRAGAPRAPGSRDGRPARRGGRHAATRRHASARRANRARSGAGSPCALTRSWPSAVRRGRRPG